MTTAVATGRKLVVTVETDGTLYGNGPNENQPGLDGTGDWKLVAFSNNSIHYENIETYFRRSEADNIVPANIGLWKKLNVGLAFPLQYFEHTLGRYDIQGHGPSDRWDTTTWGGILLFTGKPEDMGPKTYADRQKDAEGWLERYNDWMNGNVYVVTVDTVDGEEADNGAVGGVYPDELTEAINELVRPEDEVVFEGDAAWAVDEKDIKAKVVDSHDEE